jgi:hypothetical protein
MDDHDQHAPLAHSALVTAIGGRRGILDSSLPSVLFVLAYARFGLRPAVGAALALAGVLLLVRAARREPLRYAVNGFAGVAISALFALWLGRAEGFFLPGIIVNTVYATIFLGSIALRRPVVGLLLAAFQPQESGRPVDARLTRVHVWATAGWAAVFATRAGVQGALYLAGRPGWLAASKIALGWPLTLLALALTMAAVRRATAAIERAEPGPPGPKGADPAAVPSTSNRP